MSKKMLALLLFAFLLSLSQVKSSVQAVTLKVNDSGAIEFYQDSVLGDRTEEDSETKSSGKNAGSGEQQRTTQQTPQKVILPSSGRESTQIRLQPTSKNTTQLLIDRGSKDASRSTQLQKQETDRIQVEFQDKAAQLRELSRQHESELQHSTDEIEATGGANKEHLIEQEKERLQHQLEEKKHQLEQNLTPRPQNPGELEKELKNKLPPKGASISAERRQAREQELLKLQDAVKDNRREIQLQTSNGLTEHFGQGAQVSVDAKTGVVTLTTPSGETKTLNHLPSEVIQRLQEKGNFTTPSNGDIQVEVGQDGSIKHTISNVAQTKKLFGLFNRNVQGTATVDDSTGDVQFSPTQSSGIENLLNTLSL